MDSVLYDAVIKDNIDVLKGKEFKDQLTPTKNTVLHIACQHGSMKCLEHVLSEHESLLLQINSRGETGLHLAARQGHYKVVAALLDVAAKSLPSKPNCFKKTLLTVKQVMIRALNKEGDTALHMSVRYNHMNVVQLLATEDPSHSYPPNKQGETPLYLASFGCYCDIIKIILDNSESPTFGGPDGSTALHAALLNDGGHECVKLLLERNKDLIKVPNRLGFTAFHYVAYNDLHTIVEDLVGADKSAGYLVDRIKKRTALHVAAKEGNVNVMKKLVEYYPDSWDIVDNRGQNILHLAVRNNQKEVMRYILSRGCKEISEILIQRDLRKGDTPLHLIASLGCYVEELVDLRTVDWMVLNSKGLTPLDVLNPGLNTRSLADQTIIRTILINAKVKRQDLRLYKAGPIEMHAFENDKSERNRSTEWDKSIRKRGERIEKAISTHIIVAALITTVALTAGFAMPGGFDGNEGNTQGSPMLLRKAAFQIFIITDATALLLSISSLFLYFWTILAKDEYDAIIPENLFIASTLLNFFSIMAIMLAFISGTYVVLAHSLVLAISVCVISSSFFLFIFYVFFKLIQVDQSMFRRALSFPYPCSWLQLPCSTSSRLWRRCWLSLQELMVR